MTCCSFAPPTLPFVWAMFLNWARIDARWIYYPSIPAWERAIFHTALSHTHCMEFIFLFSEEGNYNLRLFGELFNDGDFLWVDFVPSLFSTPTFFSFRGCLTIRLFLNKSCYLHLKNLPLIVSGHSHLWWRFSNLEISYFLFGDSFSQSLFSHKPIHKSIT